MKDSGNIRKMVRERNRVCHALAEAVEYFEAGLDIISAEESGEWDAIELEYLISLAPLGSYLVGRNLESGLRLFHRASEMCEKVGTPGNKLDIELGRAMFEAIGGDATATYERSRALLLEAKVEMRAKENLLNFLD